MQGGEKKNTEAVYKVFGFLALSGCNMVRKALFLSVKMVYASLCLSVCATVGVAFVRLFAAFVVNVFAAYKAGVFQH
ncbi:MAG: hypothetical protein IPN72_24770 [Saprospiraceae bacterium]|nr:hypothetical protein [Saprospiraceae bacterium]